MWLAGLYLLCSFLLGCSLPLCGPNGDTYGRWIETKDYLNTTSLQSDLSDRYLLGGPGEAVNFTCIWMTDNCASHRFTNHSINVIVSHILAKQQTAAPFRVIFLGDSGTRSVFCGITRILSGSEILGPCENEVCGTEANLAVSHKSTHKLANVMFGENIELTFMYIRSLTDRYTNWMVEGNIGKKPYAVVVNTGAWDFDHIARQHMGQVANETCDSLEAEAVSLRRAQPSIQAAMVEYGHLAKSLGVRAIYRTNHYNCRFGVHCADDRVLDILNGTDWEIWDNRRVSQSVWWLQTRDGFHFDRHRVHTRKHHQQVRELALEMGTQMPGMLESQLAQSLLFALFRDTLQEFIDKGLTI